MYGFHREHALSNKTDLYNAHAKLYTSKICRNTVLRVGKMVWMRECFFVIIITTTTMMTPTTAAQGRLNQ